MAGVLTVLSVVGSIFLTPFLMVLVGIIFLASIGKSIGVRRLYIKLLLMIFEYGRVNIEVAQKKVRKDDDSDGENDVSPETGQETKVETEKSPPQGNTVPPNGVVKNGYLNHNGTSLINREDNLILLPEPNKNHSPSVANGAADSENSDENVVKHFELSTCLDYIKAGMEAIIEDQVTSRFEAEELKNWNLLTRTNRHYEFLSWRLSFVWMCGFFIRYFFLFPLRVIICCFGLSFLVTSTAIISFLPENKLRNWIYNRCYLISSRIMMRSLTGMITIYNKQYKPKSGICVANHTTPIDVLVLSTDNSFSLIGQRHGGFLGVVQRALARASPHIWFERSEAKDRHAVAARLKEHVSNPDNPPILIFPEGTCINNTSVMQFKKGSFEVDTVIYPVAIKYDPRFGDAFWDSSRYSYIQYLYMMMTSWAIVCEVWYLPPMYRKEDENAIDFANRVKSVIAKQGGLVDLVWDGQLKRIKPKKEWKERQQEEFSKKIL